MFDRHRALLLAGVVLFAFALLHGASSTSGAAKQSGILGGLMAQVQAFVASLQKIAGGGLLSGAGTPAGKGGAMLVAPASYTSTTGTDAADQQAHGIALGAAGRGDAGDDMGMGALVNALGAADLLGVGAAGPGHAVGHAHAGAGMFGYVAGGNSYRAR